MLPLDRAILVPFSAPAGKGGDQAEAAPWVSQLPATTRAGTKRLLCACVCRPAPVKGASWASGWPGMGALETASRPQELRASSSRGGKGCSHQIIPDTSPEKKRLTQGQKAQAPRTCHQGARAGAQSPAPPRLFGSLLRDSHFPDPDVRLSVGLPPSTGGLEQPFPARFNLQHPLASQV